MDKTKHCDICDNALRSMEQGLICGITNQKPQFINKCDKIGFGESLLKKIELVGFELKLTERKKWLTFFNFIFFLLVSFGFWIGGYILWSMAFGEGVLATLPFIIMFLGFMILPMATGPIRKYYFDKKSNKKKKDNLNALLDKYGLSYNSEIDLVKGYHNILNVRVDVKLFKNGKLKQEYSNQFDYNNNEKRVDNYNFGNMIGDVEIM